MRKTRNWPHAWLKARDGRDFLGAALISRILQLRMHSPH